ncbi:hypothetical protein VPNG_02136 [Cytospora leucostoma]|uniref:2EXR domain-containing protein n=1 Tax=Cytospora leucostoma TaxID=1230097 RepID=A0A423XHA8_9PEZI|nr:hypothetical protein VPNG_02136 [Cytospora leucostoma]
MSDDNDSDQHYDSDSDHDESQESSSDEAGNGLFDLEASEGDSEKDGNLNGGFDSDDDDYLESFPRFMQLPPELREMVWLAFCPDLTASPRVFGVSTMGPVASKLMPGPSLEDQTAPMRTLLAIHGETRAMGLRSSPHQFTLQDGVCIRYHEENDVIHIHIPPNFDEDEIFLAIQQLGGQPRNIAVPYDFTDTHFADLCYLLPDVRRVFILFEDLDMGELSTKDHAWVVSDDVHHYYTEVQEVGEAGLVAALPSLFCWPDIDHHRDFALHNINYSNTGGSAFETRIQACRDWLADPLLYSDVLIEDDTATEEEKAEAAARLQSIEVWPMIRFNYDSGLEQFARMKAWEGPWDEYDSASSASDDPPDEYESEGIDDGTIDGDSSTDDEDDLHIDNSSDHDAPGRLLGSSSAIHNHLAAQFSSDDDDEESDHQGNNAEASESDEEEGEDGSGSRATSKPKRRVVDSDSEDESATETEEPPRPAANRRARAVLADSEDESDEDDAGARPAQGRKRRARAVPSDSEDEDEDEDKSPQPSRAQSHRARAIPDDSDDDGDEEEDERDARESATKPKDAEFSSSSEEDSSSDEEEEDDDEDDEPPPPKRLSLAKRLKMEAQRARPGNLGGDDSDADDYGAAPDDDEEDGDGASDHDGTSVAEEEEEDDDDDDDGDGDGGESEGDH